MARRQWLPLVALIAAASLSLAAADDCKDAKVDSACVNFVPVANGSEQTCAGAGGGGGGGGATNTAVPTATRTRVPTATPTPVSIFQNRMLGYSFGDSSNCRDGDTVDTITVIFYGQGIWTVNHAIAHGLPHTVSGDQRFFDSGACTLGATNAAENSGWQVCCPPGPASRWHLRAGLSHADQSPGFSWSAGTPHYDQAVSVACWHAVPALYDGGHGEYPPFLLGQSGFDAGRRWIVHQWTELGPHQLGGYEYWGNIQLMHQCNGDWSGSDGTVAEIEILGHDD
jgi:hypothetical protein